jgi:transposase
VDGRGRPLVVMVSPGQAGDAPALLPMLAELRVARRGPGRPRTTPDLLRADKAYSARAHRQHLRRRGIKAVIPEPADQTGHRRRRGSRGGRPVSYDPVEYRRRARIECGINLLKQWRAIATRYDKHALPYRGAIVLAAILTWLR